MELDALRTYCLAMKAASEGMPFDRDTLVFKVAGKMFALTALSSWEAGAPAVNLKCAPQQALELRSRYEAVQPGYHMNKKHWNTIRLNTGELRDEQVFGFVKTSYQLVVKNLPKKLQIELE